MYARLRSQVSATSESGSPCENAKPALVVASAGNPSCCRYRAEPMSHGFGITKQPASCRVRKARRRALKFSCDPRPSVPNSSKAGQKVLDLFGGSGSTLIAAEKLGRRARLMEIDPPYCDVIIRRWRDYTGKKAVLDGDGRTFDEVATGRLKE